MLQQTFHPARSVRDITRIAASLGLLLLIVGSGCAEPKGADRMESANPTPRVS